MAADDVESPEEGLAMCPKIYFITTLDTDPIKKADYRAESKRGLAHTLCKGLKYKVVGNMNDI